MFAWPSLTNGLSGRHRTYRNFLERALSLDKTWFRAWSLCIVLVHCLTASKTWNVDPFSLECWGLWRSNNIIHGFEFGCQADFLNWWARHSHEFVCVFFSLLVNFLCHKGSRHATFQSKVNGKLMNNCLDITQSNLLLYLFHKKSKLLM